MCTNQKGCFLKLFDLLLCLSLASCKSPNLENVCDPSQKSTVRVFVTASIFGEKIFGCSAQGNLVNTSSNTTANTSATNSEWIQEAYVKASNSGSNDLFGSSVSISGDTLVVGSYLEDSGQTTITNGTTATADNSISDSGAVYVYKRSGASWIQEAYIKPPNTGSGDQFGQSVSISGDTIAVGSIFEDSSQTTITNGTTATADDSLTDAGAVYVYKRTGTSWAQEAYIKAPNADANDSFGSSVSISGDTIVVGTRLEDSNQTTITNGTSASGINSSLSAGAVYVFKRTGVTWAQEAYIKPPNNDADDNFGYSVSISSDTIIVGAVNESSNQTTITNGTSASPDNSTSQAGAAYVFKRSGAVWVQEAYIKAPNPDASDNFGYYVSIDGDTIAVGVNFEDSNQTTITNGSSASANNSSTDSGAVYIYKRSGTNWSQEAYIKPSNADAVDRFGVACSLHSDTLVVGAILEDSNQTTITNGSSASSNNTLSNSGAVYVFKRIGTLWNQEAYFKPPNIDAGDAFGYSVAISSDTIAVGSQLEDSNDTTITNGITASSNNASTDSGAVYVFRRK